MPVIFIAIPAYNCQHSIANVVRRIPQRLWKKIAQIIIVNDASADQTGKILYELAQQYKKIHILTNKKNAGYAGTQKVAYAYALGHNADIVVLLHDDGQYAPEEMHRLITPLSTNHADLVHGSRLLGGKAPEGGMPWSKYVGNIILTRIENWVCHMDLTEWHSGYVAYTRKSLQTIPFTRLSNTFHFDGEMLFMAGKLGLRILEVPISTNYFGDARSYLRPIRYLVDWLKIMWRFKVGHYNFSPDKSYK